MATSCRAWATRVTARLALPDPGMLPWVWQILRVRGHWTANMLDRTHKSLLAIKIFHNMLARLTSAKGAAIITLAHGSRPG